MKALAAALIATTILPATATPDEKKARRQPAPKADRGSDIHAEVKALEASVKELRKLLGGKEFDLRKHLAKTAALEKALAESKQASAAAAKRSQELARSLAEMEGALRKATAAKAEVEKALAATRSERAALVEKLATTQRTVEVEAAAAAQRATAERAAVEDAMEKLQKKYEMARRVTTKTLAEAAARERKDTEAIVSIRQENAALRDDCAQALEAMVGLRKQIEALNRELAGKGGRPPGKK